MNRLYWTSWQARYFRNDWLTAHCDISSMPTPLFFHESWHGPIQALNTIITYLPGDYNRKTSTSTSANLFRFFIWKKEFVGDIQRPAGQCTKLLQTDRIEQRARLSTAWHGNLQSMRSFCGGLYPRHEKLTRSPAETTGNRYEIEILMSRMQKLKGLSAASLGLKTLNDNFYPIKLW